MHVFFTVYFKSKFLRRLKIGKKKSNLHQRLHVQNISEKLSEDEAKRNEKKKVTRETKHRLKNFGFKAVPFGFYAHKLQRR